MSYTDKDILDLYEDLCTVGAALSPQEEAEAIYKSFKVYAAEHLPPSRLIWAYQVKKELILFLQAKALPIAYMLKYESAPIRGHSPIQGVYPVYKGLVIYPKVLPLDAFIEDKGWSKSEVEVFDTVKELNAAILELKGENQDKFQFPRGVGINFPTRQTT